MPISTTIMLAVLTAMRVLCFAIAALFAMLAVRTLFDAELAVKWWQALLGVAAFVLTGIAAGVMRKALVRRLQ